MTRLVRACFAALLGLGVFASGGNARAASVPVTQAETEALPDSLGYRGHRAYGPRFHRRPVYARAYYGPRRHYYRPYRPRPVYVYRPGPAYPYSCIRRGWVWNGWQYVWRRYRVC